MKVLAQLARSFVDLLKSPWLGGLPGLAILFGLMYGAASWIIINESRLNALEEAVKFLPDPDSSRDDEDLVESRASEESDVQEVKFVKKGHVRCPGGGDWLGRERNDRRTTVDYKAPSGTWIQTEPPHEPYVEVLNDNDGRHGKIVFSGHDKESRPTRVSVGISYHPPNFPGAKGGWVTVNLIGYYKKDQ